MQGHGYAQPLKQPPHPAWLAFLRVLFVAVGVFSIGFLTWAVMLRLAVVTRRSLDWGLFVAVLAADILSIVLLGSEPGDEIHTSGGYLGLTLLLGTLAGTLVYYLAADIRHFQQLRQAYAGGPALSGYGYPRPAVPFTATTVTQTPVPVQAPPTVPPMPHTPVPRPPLATPPPQRPAPARIDQVRAELDELSDYLRKHDGHQDDGQDTGHEGGR
ncbi:hypothetical protein AQI88_22030 [Streptomyces cellostaticus]|uniref:Integral membrane protein n=1 Tax=Streptomyces cellostaticus TaxID=67285 RepID=A0A124HCH1_9ACTN|nr:hypothetical protein [Streptomyces cellostaticus]KUM94387.1 hypothetical protein AQI88_22030 [Streptomyces cellostaticus]GHI07131.1 hypothetical protein Scel_54520 [Streptomyces cellostaticus]